VIGDALVAAAEDQDLDELVEHDPVGDAGWQHSHGGVRVGGVSNPGFSAPCLPSFHPPTAGSSYKVFRRTFGMPPGRYQTNDRVRA
jgi:hypothetical protein